MSRSARSGSRAATATTGSTHTAVAEGPVASSYAFGLPLRLHFPIAGLPQVPGPRDSTPLTLLRSQQEALEARWLDEEADPVYGRRFPDGRVAMLIRRHPLAGYRIWAEGYGTYVLSRDLTELECAPPTGQESWRWERFLIGQVLPLVAVLRGLEVLHASAVALNGRAVAFVGAVGAGKSSIAVQLALRSGQFFCDDVLALELGEDRRLLAHPGAAVANLRPPEVRILKTNRALGALQAVGRDAEGLRAVVPRAGEPLRLSRIYLLDRQWPGTNLVIEKTDDPRLLIGATFNVSIRSPERLVRQLELSARIAASTRVFHLRIPARVGAAEVAKRVEAHVRE